MPEILVHVHLFYPEFWNEISACLKNISLPYDLVVTLVENDSKTIENIKGIKSDARIEIVENRGFDVAPFIKVMRENDLSRYDFVIHLHSKRKCRFKGSEAMASIVIEFLFFGAKLAKNA